MSSDPSASLANLARSGLLDAVPRSAERVQRMLALARQRLQDAAVTEASNETRFECAYNAIRALADLGLQLHGYRTPTSRPGHHQMAIQCLVHTLGVDARTVVVLDALRKQRNLADYDGDPVNEVALAECIVQATRLLAHVEQRLGEHGT